VAASLMHIHYPPQYVHISGTMIITELLLKGELESDIITQQTLATDKPTRVSHYYIKTWNELAELSLLG